MASATVGILRVLLTANTAEFQTAMKAASDTAKVWSKDMQGIGRQAQDVGSIFTKAITLPIVAALGGAAKAAIDFESQFANVAKTVDGVADNAGVLTKQGQALAMTFRQMAKEIPATTGELTAIASLGGQMGVPIQSLEKFTKNVAALGVAVDGISAENAAAGLAQIANVFGDKEVRNIDKMSSALVHLGNNSNATEADILEFTKRLAGAGNSAGMTIPQIMAIGTAMANVGLNAEAGGTAMSTMIAKMSMAVSKGGSELQAFDEIVKHTGQSFTELWKGSPVEAVNAVVVGLGKAKESGADLNLVVREIGATNIRTADTMKRLAGAGDGIAVSLKTANEGWETGNKHLIEAEKKYATTANQLKLLWNQIKDVGITIGNAMLPAIKSATSMMSDLLPVVDGLAKAFAMLPGSIQMAAFGFVGLLAAAGPLIFTFGKIVESGGILIGTFSQKGIATRALTGSFTGLVGAAKSAMGSIVSLGTAARASGLLFGGLTAAVAGIAVPVALIVINDHLERMREELDAMIAASKLVKRPVRNADEARQLLAAAEAGREGDEFKGKPFSPVTIDQAQVWIKAKGAAESYEGQVVKIAGAQAKSNEQVMIGANLTVDQVAAMTKLSGAGAAYAGGVVQIGNVTSATAKKTSELAAAQKEIAEANAAYAKELSGIKDALSLQILNMDKTGKSTKELAAQYKISEDSVKRLKSELEDSAKAHKNVEKAATAAEKAEAKHTAMLEKQADALEKLGIVTRGSVLGALDELGTLVVAAADAGVPMDRILASILPKLTSLKVLSDASGIKVRELDAAFKSAAAAAKHFADDALDQIFKKLPPVVQGLQQMPGAVVNIDHASAIAAIGAQNLTDSFHYFGLKTRAELEATARAAVVHYNEIKKSGTATPAQIKDAFDRMNVAIAEAGGKSADSFIEGLQKNLERLPDVLIGAFMGGGGIKSAAQAIGSMFGADLGKQLGTSLGKNIAGLSAKWGGLIGGAFGSLLGPLLGGLVDKLFGSAGRDAVKTFADSMGGFDSLRARLNGLGAEGERLWRNLTQGVGRNNPQQAKAAIDAITAAIEASERKTAEFNTKIGNLLHGIQDLGSGLPDSLREYIQGLKDAGKLTEDNIALLSELSGSGEVDWHKIQAAVERYGGDISKLGGTFQAQRLHDGWQQIIDDMDLFERGNISAGDALDLTKGKIIDLVNESVRFGTEIPENMRPWIQKLIDAGELVDDNGQKITDIGKLKFGETLQTSLQILTQTIKDLIDEFKKVPGAINAIPKNVDTTVTVRHKTIFEEEGNPPGFDAPTPAPVSKGGIVTTVGVRYLALGGPSRWKPRGTDTIPAMLTPGEGVVNTRGMSILGVDGLSALNQGMDALRNGALNGGSRLAASTPLESGPMTVGPFVMNFPPGELARVLRDGGPVIVEAWTHEVRRGGGAETRVRGALGIA